MQQTLSPEGLQVAVHPEGEAGEVEEESEEGQGDEDEPKKKGLATGIRIPIYQKLIAIREVDRLIEQGVKSGIEKKVMATFPHIFMGTKGKMKSGMLGRWLQQCDEQDWRKVPFEKMSVKDQQIKDLPDWIRLPMGLPPRSLDKFKSGSHVPMAVTRQIIQCIEKVTCGGSERLTSSTLNTESIRKQADTLLATYNEAQKKAAEENGIAMPDVKSQVSVRWVNRLLQHFGWIRAAPNTLGAYLEYDDERMVKSRQAWHFLRTPGCFEVFFYFLWVFPTDQPGHTRTRTHAR